MTVVLDDARPRSQTALSGVTALVTNIRPVAAVFEQTTFSISNTSSNSFQTRDCQEVLCKEKVKKWMKGDLTI